ncbi:ATP-binding protein [Streptomyces sp. NPDC006175]|uniref:ATP-binding protein n=1 Tax=unclassified Streptomyces TaxID=2593676 RepID=UPI0033B2F13F
MQDLGQALLAPLIGEPPDDDAALPVARVRVPAGGAVAAWEYPAVLERVADVRAETAGQLTRWGLDELGFTTELIVSELVTNAIRYAGGPVLLRLIKDRRLICEVSDTSQTQPHLRRALTDEGCSSSPSSHTAGAAGTPPPARPSGRSSSSTARRREEEGPDRARPVGGPGHQGTFTQSRVRSTAIFQPA